jgi:hypothetical protein
MLALVNLYTTLPNPYDLIRRAKEVYAGNPAFSFNATTGATALIVFNSAADREEALSHFRAYFEGVQVELRQPEQADKRTTTRYDMLAELEATGYPLDQWHFNGANFVFGHLGKLCCLVPGDFTSMRAFVLVESSRPVPRACVIRLPGSDIVDVRLRLVQAWMIDDDLVAEICETGGSHNMPPPSHSHHFANVFGSAFSVAGPAAADGAIDTAPPAGETPDPVSDFGGVPVQHPSSEVRAGEVPAQLGDTTQSAVDSPISDDHERNNGPLDLTTNLAGLAIDETFDFGPVAADQGIAQFLLTPSSSSLPSPTNLVPVIDTARRLDTSRASARLASARDASRILVDIATPVASADALAAVARACGADDAEAPSVADAQVTDVDP